MAVVSGKFGKIMAGASNLLEVRNWKLSTSGGSRTYTSSSTSGMQRTVDGVHSGTVSFELVLDPAGPIEDQLDIGDLASMMLYRTASDMYSVTCRITSVDDDVNIEEGEPPTLAVEADTHGAWYGPLSFPTPKLWLDADCTSSLTLDGSSVSAWQSKGTGAAAFSHTGANRPTYVASGIGGQPSIAFAIASSQYLAYTGTVMTAAAGTFICVTSFSSNTAMQIVYAQANPAVANQFSTVGRRSSDSPAYRWVLLSGTTGVALSYGTAQLAHSTPYILTATSGGASNWNSWINGAVDSVANTGVTYWPGALASDTHSYIGAVIKSDGNAYHGGQLAEIMAWDTVLTQAELNSVKQYLARKYSITVS